MHEGNNHDDECAESRFTFTFTCEDVHDNENYSGQSEAAQRYNKHRCRVGPSKISIRYAFLR